MKLVGLSGHTLLLDSKAHTGHAPVQNWIAIFPIIPAM